MPIAFQPLVLLPFRALLRMATREWTSTAVVTIDSVIAGSNSAAFDSFRPQLLSTSHSPGVVARREGNLRLAFSSPIPAQYISLNMSQGTPTSSTVPEPGTFGLLSGVSAAVLIGRRWRSKSSI